MDDDCWVMYEFLMELAEKLRSGQMSEREERHIAELYIKLSLPSSTANIDKELIRTLFLGFWVQQLSTN